MLTSKKGKIVSKQYLFGRSLLRREGKMLTNRWTYCRQLILSCGRRKQTVYVNESGLQTVYVNENGLHRESIERIMRGNQSKKNRNGLICCSKNHDRFVTGETGQVKLKGPKICWYIYCLNLQSQVSQSTQDRVDQSICCRYKRYHLVREMARAPTDSHRDEQFARNDPREWIEGRIYTVCLGSTKFWTFGSFLPLKNWNETKIRPWRDINIKSRYIAPSSNCTSNQFPGHENDPKVKKCPFLAKIAFTEFFTP